MDKLWNSSFYLFLPQIENYEHYILLMMGLIWLGFYLCPFV